MFSVISCIRDKHDWRLIVAAAIICLVGSLATMLLLHRAQQYRGGARRRWIMTAALTSGTSIWSTHFIAMLAYDGGWPVSYDIRFTLLSILLAIYGSGFGFAVAFQGGNTKSFAMGGFLLALSVAAMHFTGMMAITGVAGVVYGQGATIVAITLGAVIGAVALASFEKLRGRKRLVVSAIGLVVSICSLHFVSMSGVTLVPHPDSDGPAMAISHGVLAGIVIAASVTLILVAIASVFLDRRLTDLRGLANASLEGLLIVRDGRIIDANERIVEISGFSLAQLIGRSPDILLASGTTEISEESPVETSLAGHDGRRIPVEAICRMIAYRGRRCRVYVVRDLTERKKNERLIEHLAHHDALTDLPNRSLFNQRIWQALQLAERKQEEVAIFCLDLDRFKAVNDIFGHAEGDRILCRVAGILRRVVDEGDTVARLGGDEFAIIQPGKSQPQAARQLADRLLEEFAAEMDMARDPTAVGVSVGITLFPADGQNAEQLCCNADTALYRVKHSSRGHACFFDAEMDEAVRTRRQLESDLRQAILRRQLHVSYQPIMNAKTGLVSGYEALMRWSHPSCGLIEPDVFIPIAEESGSILQLGAWILEQACLEAVRWPQPLTVAVNISPVQFMLPNLYEQVEQTLAETGLEPWRLELEITEAALVRDRERVMATLQKLRLLGVHMVMDDFGTGYSSLSNLRSFPFHKIKVDRSFTGALEHDPAARSIVRAIIGLGHSLNMTVVTEGVETEAQRRIVTEEGCAEVQGLFLGKPDIEPSAKLAARTKLRLARE